MSRTPIVVADAVLPLMSLQGLHGAGALELRRFQGRRLEESLLHDATVLIVRSSTRVTRSLCENTGISMVVSATSGLEHIDEQEMHALGINVKDARGGNADAVAEHVLAMMTDLYTRGTWSPQQDRTVGLIGYGATGSALGRRMQRWGWSLRVYDPFVKTPWDASYPEVLRSSIVSFHVPLTDGGEHPTASMFGDSDAAHLREGALVVNACRGPVFAPSVAVTRPDVAWACDVYRDEAQVTDTDPQGFGVMTPHVAAWTVDARCRVAHVAEHEVCVHLGQALPQPLAVPAAPHLVPSVRNSVERDIDTLGWPMRLMRHIRSLEADQAWMARCIKRQGHVAERRAMRPHWREAAVYGVSA